ncbi:DUF4198 domain-containing protein [Variovorax sp. YR752]|uniref:DUF4198 domain-containing protein n=1 Tax=Variovorax sp. YR752 TaxID=1884383 RepID=UPI00313789F9
MRHLRLSALAAGLIAAAPVAAHDTWFQVEDRNAAGSRTLALGTGNRFPLQETPIGAEYLVASGCRAGGGELLPLEPLRVGERALLLRTPPAHAGLSCWAQSQPFEITLAPALVEAYLKEIAAPPSVHAAWADMRSRGIAWTERYAKHARIELPGTQLRRAAVSSGMAMDARPLGEVGAWQVGDSAGFEVLRDGRPLPDFAVEFRHERAPVGVWRRTDAQGRVEMRLPLPGRWVLRGTELRAVPDTPGHWESRFVTLAFEVAAREKPDTQNGMNSRPNARSVNHSAASSAIASEPPLNTAR